MNKVLSTSSLLVMLISLFGCSTVKYIEASKEVVAFDFSSFTREGFMVTPEGYDRNYESVGIISMDLYPEWQTVDVSDVSSCKVVNKGRKALVEKSLTTENVSQEIVSLAKGMGANAIIRFKVESIEKSIVCPREVVRHGIHVTGFAIKRIE